MTAFALADHTDTYLMVVAWNTSPTGRAVALDLADRNREQAVPAAIQTITAPIDLSKKESRK
jgi:hypothetical protein